MKRFYLRLMAFMCIVFLSSHLNAQITLPSLVRTTKPLGINAPGETFSPPVSGGAKANTPQVGEWTRTAGPDESIILTGVDFSKFTGNEEGKDTRFTVYGSGIKKDAKIQRIDGYKAIITLDKAMPRWSMYLVWPANENGYGTPVAINKTDSWWLGPDRAVRGRTISVFGRNLSENNDTLNSHVYIKGANGAGQWAAIKKVNPYKVDFVVPANLANGSYEVWTHNGHGGDYGWSGPLTLSVHDEPKWVSNVLNVKDYGAKGDGRTDDLTAIRSAIAAAKATPGSTVYFPAGTYMVSSHLGMSSLTRWKGDGKDKTFIKCSSDFDSDNGFITGAPDVFELSDLTFDTDKNYRGRISCPFFWRYAQNLYLNNVRLKAQNYDVVDLHHTRYVFVTNTEMIGKVSFLGQGSQLFFDRSVVKLTNDTDMGIYSWGGNGISMTNTTCQDYDNSNVNDGAGWGKGRFLTFMGLWGSNRNTYIGNVTTTDLSPRPHPDVDQNSGEQFLWEGFQTNWKGSPTAATATTVSFSGYTLNNDVRYATIVKGRGLGQSRRIVSNNGGVLTLDEPWNLIPDNNSVITIGTYADRTVLYGNYLDAKSNAATSPDHIASAGIQPYGGVTNFIADNNTLHQLRQGTCHWTVQEGNITPTFFSLYANNKYIGCRSAIINEQGIEKPANETSMVGTIYRRNVIQNSVRFGIQQIGKGYDYPITDATMYEHNVLTGVPVGYNSIANGIINQAFYSNSFSGINQANSFGYTITSKLSIRGNEYSEFQNLNSGLATELIVEAPYHVVELFAVTDTVIVDSTFTLWNSGTTQTIWSATSSAPWLTLQKSSGSIEDEKAQDLIEFKASAKGLAEGAHRAYITVKAGTETKVYTILLNVGEAAVPDPVAPTVSITAPVSGTSFNAAADITITADASTQGGTISKVEFFQGSTKLGEDLSAPYSFSWIGVASGTYTITAKAIDSKGLSTASEEVSITVNVPSQPTAPNITITSPANSSSFTVPAAITITADASDADGTVAKVEFFQGSTKLGEALSAPYSFVWDNAPAGIYSITAKAIDNSGLSKSSEVITIAISAPGAAPVQPTIQITSPDDAAITFQNFITISAIASDPDGSINKVEFFNGNIKIGEANSAPYTFTWTDLSEGHYILTAKATDNSGLSTTSQQVSVIVSKALVYPTVNLISLTRGVFTAPANINLTAEANDADGSIKKVEFFSAGTKIGESSNAPYNINWNNVEAGVYTITAKATDNNGLTTISAVMVVIVSKPKVPPTIQLTSPTNNSYYGGPTNIKISADASAVDASIVKVEFFSGGIKLGEDVTSPYELEWTNVPVGSYQIMAKVTDDNGLTATTEYNTISLIEKNKLNIYPNPVKSVATIEFSLTRKAYVEMQIFNSVGGFISTPFKGVVEANQVKQIPFNGSSLPNGVYFCRLMYNDGLSYFKKWLENKIVIVK